MSKPFDCVVAADASWGIGRADELPWPRLREDLRFLRRITSDAPAGQRNAVIMGRKTFASIPPKMSPLPGRLNVSVSRGPQALADGVLAATSLDDALDQAAARAEIAGLFVLGGGEIYRLAFAHPRCRHVYLTRVDGTFACDTFIAPLAPGFVLDEVLAEHHDETSDLRYRMERWTRATAPVTPPPGT